MRRPSAILMLITIGIIFAVEHSPSIAEAGLLFHAAKRSAARSIMKSGFRKSLMNSQGRFGAGAYLSQRRGTAISERLGAQSMIAFRKGKSFDRRVLDTRSMSIEQLKTKFHVKDMRGAVKSGVIGPKLGRRIGNYAGRNDRIVGYRSAKDPRGANYVIPKKVYSRKAGIVSPVKIIDLQR